MSNVPQTVLQSLNQALHNAMSENDDIVMLGEDLLDPYGGAFKVSKGLSDRFGERVWTTPISELGIIGLSVGMALRGLRPVAEIMFGDFLMPLLIGKRPVTPRPGELSPDQVDTRSQRVEPEPIGDLQRPLEVRHPEIAVAGHVMGGGSANERRREGRFIVAAS